MGVTEWIVLHPWVISPILLVAAFFYDIYMNIRNQFIFWKYSSPKDHDKRVRYVQKQVREWREKGNGRKMCTARPGWSSVTIQVLLYKEQCYKIEVNLMDILKIDTDKRIVTVEPLVTIGELMDYLVPLGWMVPVVPELRFLTVGGLVMGGGLETTSHKYGMWQFICMRYEMVLADASVVECSLEKNEELYHTIPWSYGTLGFLTAVDLQIVPYKPYMKVLYQPTFSTADTAEVFNRETLKDVTNSEIDKDHKNDSIEGIIFSKDRGVVMTGMYVDEAETDKINSIGRWYKPWFYKHVETMLERGRTVEYIPTKDFFFRHDRPVFWSIEMLLPFGNHPIFRYLLGWMMPLQFSFLKWINEYALSKSKNINAITQDFGIPSRRLEKALEYYHEHLELYPVWMCPIKAKISGPVDWRKDDDPILVDVGMYGIYKKPNFNRERVLQQMERHAIDNKGYLGLYAEIALSYEDFNEMFDTSHYLKMRKKLPLAEEAFPEVYEKVKTGRKPTQ